MGCSLSSPRFWGSDGGSFWNLGSLEGSTQAVGSPVVWSWAAKLSPDHWDPGSATVFKIWPPSGFWGLPWWLSGLKKKKKSACQCRRLKRREFNPWVGKFPEGGDGNPLQCSCLGNPTDRGAWQATV